MKKTFPLTSPGHQAPRVVAAIKSDVRKYVKRERRKPLPEGVDFWDFDCKAGPDRATAAAKHVDDLIPAIDEAAATGGEAIYIEILSKPGVRAKKDEPKAD